MDCYQRAIRLEARSRGFHIITADIEREVPEIALVKAGIAHIFVQHTSASLTINENTDPAVRMDFEAHFGRLVPEDSNLFRHTLEGPDDMTSHAKSSLLGASVMIPVSNGRLNLGTWQSVYLCEHRNRGGARSLVVTLYATGF